MRRPPAVGAVIVLAAVYGAVLVAVAAGILVLVALPLALLTLRSSRAWLAVGWVPSRR
jgi:hypothetical protein